MKKKLQLLLTLVLPAIVSLTNNCAKAQTTTSQSFDATSLPTSWYRSSSSAVTFGVASTTFPGATPHSGAGMADLATGGSPSNGFNTLITKSADLTYACSSCSPTISFYIWKDSRWAGTASSASLGTSPVNDYVEVYVNTTQSLTGYPYLLDRVNTRTDMFPVASAGWYKNTYTIPSQYYGQTVYFVFKCWSSGNDGDDVLIDDVSYTEFASAPTNMAYTASSAIATQSVTTAVYPGTYNQQIIGVQVAATGCASSINATSLTFNTTGTTSANDIANARVFYTGTSSTFAATSQFGTTTGSPSGTFTVTGSQALSAGTNYFWLAYDILPTATYTDLVDAQCTSITVNGSAQTPSTTNPAGNRTITENAYCTPTFSAACNAATYARTDLVNVVQGATTILKYPSSGTSGCASGVVPAATVTGTLTKGTTYTANITLAKNNTTGNNIQCMGWIDYNRDGTFSSSESVFTGTMSAAATSGIVSPTFTVSACALPGLTRMRVSSLRSNTAFTTSQGCSSLTGSGEYEDYYVTIAEGGTAMGYTTTATSQPVTDNVTVSSTNQQMVQIHLTVSCGSSPLSVSSFSLNTTGTTNVGDIINAKLYYTGTSSTFATTNLFGEQISPSGSYTITGNQTLAGSTDYYFWLTYDVSSSANIGNSLSAQCSAVIVGGTTRTLSSPITASREIDINMGNGVYYAACGGKLYDSGGSGASNSPAECYAVVLYSNNGNNANITFQNWTLQSQADVINIYNGVGTSGTLLKTFNGNTAAYDPTIALSASACNGYGVITIEYLSCASSTGTSNFSGSISCSSTNTLTWVGGSGSGATKTDWGTAANWTPAKVPTPCYDVTVPSTTSQPICSSAQADSCKNLTVNSTATLTVQSTTGALNVYGSVTNNGTINFSGTSSSSSTTPYIHLYSKAGTISGSGTYTNFPIYFYDQSAYTISNNASFTYFYMYRTAAVTHSGSNTINITKSLTQAGTWSLGSSTVNYTGDDGTGSAPNYPDLYASKFSAGTSTFNYNSTSNKQYVTAASYYNLSVNNNSSYSVPVGYYTSNSATSISCNNFSSSAGTAVTSGYLCIYTPLTVAGNLTIGTGTVLDANDHASGVAALTTDNSISLGGNWTNNGSFINGYGYNASLISNPRTVLLNGSSMQTIGGTATSTFYNLILNQAGTTTQLSNSAAVANILTLNSNILDLNTKTLTLSKNSTGAITRSSGYVLSEDANVGAKINWNISTTNGSYIYPFGYSGTYIPFTFQLTDGNDAGYVSVATYHPTGSANTPYPPGVTHLSDTTVSKADNSGNTVSRFWQINKAGAAGKANITFTYLDGEKPSGGEDSLRAQRWNSTKKVWQKWYSGTSGQTANYTSNTVTANGVTSFSPWTLARKLHPLPVTLLNFNAIAGNDQVNLTWQTASEINNAKFTTERSKDATNFEDITNVPGAGNSNTTKDYSSIDFTPYAGISYYRLRQTDFDGRYTYSEVKEINMLPKANVAVIPNPVTTSLTTLVVNSSVNEQGTVRVFNEMGKMVYQSSESYPIFKGKNQIELNTEGFKPGIYLVKITMNNTEINSRFIKQQ